MMHHRMIRSPKRDQPSRKKSANLYHYYAGFSPKFVKDVIAALNIDNGSVIMDPWNGSGTTTQVARDMGFSAIGFDINPVMVIVAKAMLLNCTLDIKRKILDDLDLIIEIAATAQNGSSPNEEPLDSWLESESARYFRSLEKAIYHLQVSDDYCPIYSKKRLECLSSLASFYYLALFRTLRDILAMHISSNPTWIKMSSAKKDCINPSRDLICTELKKQICDMININILNDVQAGRNSEFIKIDRASSDSIPLPNSSIDLVISSPPYCTRIDYAIATSPELALLGCSMNTDIKNLRDRMIGTPTIIHKAFEVKLEWGPACESFLSAVECHDSKASKSYYYKYYVQYFDSIFKSLIEIDRTLMNSGNCVIVAQDSYNKNIHNDLPKIFCEMAGSLGWITIDRLDFDIKRTMASCNRRTKKYRIGSNATESVLVFKKVN